MNQEIMKKTWKEYNSAFIVAKETNMISVMETFAEKYHKNMENRK